MSGKKISYRGFSSLLKKIIKSIIIIFWKKGTRDAIFSSEYGKVLSLIKKEPFPIWEGKERRLAYCLGLEDFLKSEDTDFVLNGGEYNVISHKVVKDSFIEIARGYSNSVKNEKSITFFLEDELSYRNTVYNGMYDKHASEIESEEGYKISFRDLTALVPLFGYLDIESLTSNKVKVYFKIKNIPDGQSPTAHFMRTGSFIYTEKHHRPMRESRIAFLYKKGVKRYLEEYEDLDDKIQHRIGALSKDAMVVSGFEKAILRKNGDKIFLRLPVVHKGIPDVKNIRLLYPSEEGVQKR